MSIAQNQIGHWQSLLEGTKQHLERVPEDKLDWRPHPKSFTLGELASHVATLAGWSSDILGKDRIDADENNDMALPELKTTGELVSTFEQTSDAFVAALGKLSDEELSKRWVMTWNGHPVIDAKRSEVVEMGIIEHLIHHRAQLGVYLRLLDVPVPATYGPTADEMV